MRNSDKKEYIIGICAVSDKFYRNAKRLISDISLVINVDFIILTDNPSEFEHFENVKTIKYNESLFNYQDKFIIFEEGFKTHESVLLIDADHYFLYRHYKLVLENFDSKDLEPGLYAREVFGPLHYSSVDKFFEGNLPRLPYGKYVFNFCRQNNINTEKCLFVHESFFLIKKHDRINLFLETWSKLKEFWSTVDPSGYGEGFAIGISAKQSGLNIDALKLEKFGKIFEHFSTSQKKFLHKEDENGKFIKVLNQKKLPLVVAFASTASEDELVKYEFFYSDNDCNFLFLKDDKRLWYHHGVEGFGDTIQEVADNIKKTYEEFESTKLITIGFCGGGYAALLFGSILDADLIITASPRISLIEPWDDNPVGVVRRNIPKEFFDIRYTDVLRFKFHKKTKIIVGVGLQLGKDPYTQKEFWRQDVQDAKKLWMFENCIVLNFPGVGHDAALPMIKSGRVSKLIKNFINQ